MLAKKWPLESTVATSFEPCLIWVPGERTQTWKAAAGISGLIEKDGTPFQYSYLENPTGGGGWKAAVHGVAEGQTRLSDFTFTFHFHALEKEMATHSSVLA